MTFDTTPLTLLNFNLPDTVDVSNGAAVLSTYIDVADDLSDVSGIYVWFDKEFRYSLSTTSPDYDRWPLLNVSDEETTDTLISATNRPGVYSVDRISLEDRQGNERTYNSAELESLGFNTSFEIVGSASDNTPPTLLSFTLPDVVDVSNGAGVLSTYIDVADDQSEVSSVYVWFDEEFGASRSINSSNYSRSSLLNLTDGEANERLVSAINRPGMYMVDRISLEDGQGNERVYDTAELEMLGVDTSFEIVGSTSDNTPPTLLSFTLPDVVDVSNGAAVLSTYIDVADDQSEVSSVYVWFDETFRYSHSTTSPNYTTSSLLSLSDEEVTDRLISATNRPGTYSIDRISLEDGQGNGRIYDTAELESLGFNTAFEILNGPPKASGPLAELSSKQPIEVVEGTSISLPLTFKNLTNASIRYEYSFSTSGGSAGSADFFGGSGQGAISIFSTAPTDRSIDIPFSALADNEAEAAETVFLNISVGGTVFADGSRSQRYEITILDNARPTGTLDLSGRPLEGTTLAVDSSNVSDSDGLGPFSFQWLRDGRIIAGQTKDTYTISQDDVASRISVEATYTDGAGATETIQSAATLAVEDRFDLAGNGDADRLEGSTRAETLDGRGGNDTISGGGNTDILLGGAGNDVIFGDAFELHYALSEANQVFRLYQATFNRSPDEQGHKRWASELFSGESSLADVREGFVGSKEFRDKYADMDDAAFVKKMYINVLNRDFDQGEVTQTEIDNWTNRITETFTRADVVNGFAESQQLIKNTWQAANHLAVTSDPLAWSDDVYRLYRATLDRDPDIKGFETWSEKLSDGVSLSEVISGFTNSREFSNTYGALSDPEDFVKLLYDNVLDRNFDDGDVSQSEVDGWTGRLSETFTRADVVRGFSQSIEFKNKTADDLKAWIRSQGVDDKIDGGAGKNILAGGTRADFFVFNKTDGSTNTVLDLEAWDYISFEGFGYNAASEAKEHMAQVGNAVVFSDQGTEATFERFQLSDVTDDMILV